MCPVRASGVPDVPGVPATTDVPDAAEAAEGAERAEGVHATDVHQAEPLPGLPPPGGPPLPPGSPGPRRLPLAVLLTAGAVALVVLAVLAFSVGPASGGGRSGPGTVPGAGLAAPSLPWPRKGQASVLVEGLGDRGDLGTKGERTPVPIASLTKVMTAYVVLGDHPLDGREQGPDITVDQQAADESVSGVESSVPVPEGKRLSERRVLEMMLIPSGNNIARMLARWDAGTQEAFVTKMNRAARALGMRHTTYTGASGLEATTTSTSADQLKLARRVMRDEAFRSIVAEPRVAVPDIPTVPGAPRSLANTNTLLGTDGVIGLKTGSSTPAGGALMWAATASGDGGHDRLILGVVLHQRAGTSPQEGLDAALNSSRVLIEGVQRWLSGTGATPTGPSATPLR